MKSLVCMVAVCWGMVAWGTSELRAQQQQRRQIPGVKIIRDLEYSKVDGKTLLLDLYLPENVTGKLPMIVGIHGGGWAQGSKEGGTGAQMAREGYAVAVINYRLSGEAKFPAQIIDCKSAVRWLRANADKYNLDADRFGATGHSAGGHLVSLLATSGDVKEFDVGQNLGFSSRIQAAAPSAGPTDLSQMDAHAVPGARLKHNAPDSPESQLIGGPVLENLEIVKKINPINYVDENDPPFYIIHGDQDATVTWHQAELLFEALKKAGVEVHFHTIKGGGHSGGSPEAQRGMVSFFDEHLKGAGGNKKGVAE